jgi:serpin B
MKTKLQRIICVVAATATISIMLSGCASKGVTNTKMVSQVKTEAHALQNLGYEVMQQPISEADFAFKLGWALSADVKETENFVYSPLSAWLPLAALASATDAENKPALLEAIGATGVTEEQLNDYAQMLLYRVTGEGNREYVEGFKSPLKIANALFVSQNETVKQSFAQTFADSYLGTTFNVDFESQQAADSINAWASEHTDGLIDNVVESFNPETIAAIANAIYYSDRWNWEFDESETKSDVFHAAGSDATAEYMLREGDAQMYYEDERVQAMPLSFKNGGSLWIILPKTVTANELYQTMTADYFGEISGGTDSATGKLLLPKFEIADKLNLADALTALGVPLFDEDAASLTGGLIESNKPVCASSAVQKAMIKVDEKGTTAAAVTVVAMAGSAMPLPTEPFEMVCDKPFVFVLENYGQILFMGIVNNPAIAP